MSLYIYNTLTRQKELFVPHNNNHVNIYVCGVTVYDRCHIGHARNVVVFDTIVRYLKFKGYNVKYVRNFTDIDDKIIKRAHEEGIDPHTLAEREIHNFYEDLAPLKLLPPDYEPKATEHIQEMINFIKKLIDKGYAYIKDGDVYFSVRKFKNYGELSKRDIDELLSGVRITLDEDKEDPLDFALWKKSKDGEPGWENPFGEKGRPGWHIECSAMSMKYLGETIDIHGGGLDLIFPHHENEKAQSEALTQKTFVKYWVHNGFVTVNGEKMSKSLGNFFTVKDILSQFEPEALRLFLLSKHYRSPLDFNLNALKESELAIIRGYQTILNAQKFVTENENLYPDPNPSNASIPLEIKTELDTISNLQDKFIKAMDDDFNSAQAIGYIFETLNSLNKLTQNKKNKHKIVIDSIKDCISTLKNLSQVLGIFTEDPQNFIDRKNEQELLKIGLNKEKIHELIELRNKYRAEKNWTEADKIRDELLKYRIKLMDHKNGTQWSIAYE